MSSAGGGSGVGGGNVSANIQFIEGAQVQLGDAKVDLQTAEGLAQAEALLSPEQLAELEGLMRQAGFRRAGDHFVPRDDYAVRKELGVNGPTASDVGQSDLEAEIYENVYKPLGLPNPRNANTTDKTFAEIGNLSEFGSATNAMTNYLANPTNANQAEFMSRMRALEAVYPNGNIMEVLFLVFRESIKETNEDKKYFLLKLQEFNKMAEGLSDYLAYLVDKSQELGDKCEGQKYPDKVHIDVTTKEFDLSTLSAADASGQRHLIVTKTENHRPDRASLNDEIKNLESMQETVRNKRQMASTAFQNFDQKANQLYNLMSSVLKSLNEMRGGTVRNML
jgi:methyl-accepting chemotaxis protein